MSLPLGKFESYFFMEKISGWRSIDRIVSPVFNLLRALKLELESFGFGV